MPQYSIPPWISQGADPAAHYQTGLQIGARIGAEQAAQQYQQQQLLREQQKDEFDKQYKTAVLQMQVDEVTQKHRAMSDYQSMIAQGVDPMTALRQVGPQMGVSPDKIEQIDAANKMRKQQQEQLQTYRMAQLAKPSAAYTEGLDLAKAKEQLAALPEGSPEKSRLQTIVDSMESRHGMEEISVESPSGPTIRITKGAKKSTTTPTGAEQTRLGNDLQATANSLRVLNRLEGQLDSNAVGIMPTINSVLFDEVLGQFDKGLVDKHRAAARQNIGLATQQVLGELNNQGRFSNMELNAIKEAMPGLGMVASTEAGKIKVQQLQKVLAEKGAHAGVTLKRDIPSEIIQSLSRISDRELIKEVKDGALDKEVFWKVFDFKHPEGK